jgi:hypothetical protein
MRGQEDAALDTTLAPFNQVIEPHEGLGARRPLSIPNPRCGDRAP